LALRAGVRVETLCRIETGKHTPSVPTIDKLDRALKQTAKQQAGPRKRSKIGKSRDGAADNCG
jgi:transcriptional regulator with XRE-family HTH domain